MRSFAFAIGLGGCLTAVVGHTPAAANPVKSLYTTVQLKACKQVKRHRDGGAWLCDGLAGLPVYVAEGDLRQFLSVGEDAQKRRAATQTLGAFNTIFENGSDRDIRSAASIVGATAESYAIISASPRRRAARATCWWCRR